MSYFDSAYVAKFYLEEPDSEAVRRLAESLGQVHCIVLGQLEVVAVFRRKFRGNAFEEATFREVMAQWGHDCAHGGWSWLPVSAALVARAARTFQRLPKSVFLRAVDALHLTCAREHGLREIYTNDRHMSSAARHFRLRAGAVGSR